jgi:hypothetical protein
MQYSHVDYLFYFILKKWESTFFFLFYYFFIFFFILFLLICLSFPFSFWRHILCPKASIAWATKNQNEFRVFYVGITTLNKKTNVCYWIICKYCRLNTKDPMHILWLSCKYYNCNHIAHVIYYSYISIALKKLCLLRFYVLCINLQYILQTHNYNYESKIETLH